MNEQQIAAEKALWEQRYAEGKTGWDRGGASPALAHWFASAQPPQGRVLVPGCGHGHEVADLVAAGCQVTAVDIAEQPVAHLRAQMRDEGFQAEVVQADLLDWDPAEPFDAIYEQTCVCALAPSFWADYEQRLHSWLKPGGTLFALFMQTGRDGGPPYDCPMPAMRELFAAERWDWPSHQAQQIAHPNGLHELAYLLVRR